MAVVNTTDLKKGIESFDTFINDFLPQAFDITHKASTFLVLETMVAWARVSDGEMRAGWFSYMDAYNHPYVRSLSAITAPKDMTSIGKSLGSYSESTLLTTINNNVPYIDYVDGQQGVFDMDGKESYLTAIYPTFLSSISRLTELYAYGWSMGLQDIDNAFQQGFSTGTYDIGLIRVDNGQPTNSEVAVETGAGS